MIHRIPPNPTFQIVYLKYFGTKPNHFYSPEQLDQQETVAKQWEAIVFEHQQLRAETNRKKQKSFYQAALHQDVRDMCLGLSFALATACLAAFLSSSHIAIAGYAAIGCAVAAAVLLLGYGVIYHLCNYLQRKLETRLERQLEEAKWNRISQQMFYFPKASIPTIRTWLNLDRNAIGILFTLKGQISQTLFMLEENKPWIATLQDLRRLCTHCERSLSAVNSLYGSMYGWVLIQEMIKDIQNYAQFLIDLHEVLKKNIEKCYDENNSSSKNVFDEFSRFLTSMAVPSQYEEWARWHEEFSNTLQKNIERRELFSFSFSNVLDEKIHNLKISLSEREVWRPDNAASYLLIDVLTWLRYKISSEQSQKNIDRAAAAL